MPSFQMTRRQTAKPKALMMKERSNQRAADCGDRLVRAALICGPGPKICPPERATELLEATIEPGDRIVIAGDNQKQVSQTDRSHAGSSEESHEQKATRIREIRNEELERTKDYPGGAPRRRTQVRFGQDDRSRGSAEFP